MRVRFEPIGEEIDCGPQETVLDAAFRHGYNLAYGCREGQCSACKCFLIEGEVALKPYSIFALSESEQRNGYSLMCRAMPEQDLTLELLHYDPDHYRLEHPIREGIATVETVQPLTHDITQLLLQVREPQDFSFLPGQYIDLWVPGGEGARRSFSFANLPADPPRIELMIKRYPGGRLSGMLDGRIKPGDQMSFTGPYGALHLRRSERAVLMIAGGSGMAPVLSLLRQLASEGCESPIRFFYGARTERDLFHLHEIEQLGQTLTDFRFEPVLSEVQEGRFVHQAVDEFLAQNEAYRNGDVYMCGPPPMLEAAEDMLVEGHGIDGGRIFQDKFTIAAEADPERGGRADGGGRAAPAVDGRAASDAGGRAASDVGELIASSERVAQESSAGGAEDGRDFDWFEPRRRRATLYEDVTIDTQPSIHRHLRRGWPVSFEDGRGTWDEGSTRLRSSDWYAFRDPAEQWERSFYQLGSALEQQIEAAVRSAEREGLFEDFSKAWVQFLRRFLQVPAYVEHGLWLSMAAAGRACLSDSVATCVCLQAAMKQRSAQAIVLYAMDLERALGAELPIDAARDAFLTEEPWQEARRYLERLAASTDWGEVIVAANLLFEPIVGTLLRREMGVRAAAANGDVVTPVLARVATQEWEWTRAWTIEFVHFLLGDPRYARANRESISGWVDDWLPQAREAALALVPLAAEVPEGLDPQRALSEVERYAGSVLEEAGIAQPTATGVPARVAPGRGQRTRVAPGRQESTPRRRERVLRTARTEATIGLPPPAAGTRAGPGEGTYDYVGIVMAKSAEGDAVADMLAKRRNVVVHEQPAFWDIRAPDRLIIPYDEVSERLGYEIDAYSIQHEMSTHYGRMVATDEALMLFADPVEAMSHLMS